LFFDQAITEYLRYLALAERSPETLDAVRYDLCSFKDDVELIKNGMVALSDVETKDVERHFEEAKSRGLASSTRRRRLINLRAFYRFCMQRGYAESDPTAGVPLPSIRYQQRRHLEPDEVMRFVRGAKRPAVKAIALVMFYTGMRIGEVCSLRLEDVDLERRQVRVIGKGRKERLIPLNESCVCVLKWYLQEVRPKVDSDRFFVTASGKLEPDYAGDLLRSEAKRLGFHGVSCHTFRHSFATALWKKKVDLITLSALLGHSSTQTTEIYTHMDPRMMVDAVLQLDSGEPPSHVASSS